MVLRFLLDQLVGVLQHEEAGVWLRRGLLVDVEAGDGRLTGPTGRATSVLPCSAVLARAAATAARW